MEDVVLLDVTFQSGSSYAGFTFSPWFLDIPHQDILFATNSATIEEAEEWKLESTLEQLKDVLDKYGPVIPVKLYIGGCTDTVGDRQSNQALSKARARSIAKWLSSHGYDQPIFYHGFGEDWLAVPTKDGVNEAANRKKSTLWRQSSSKWFRCSASSLESVEIGSNRFDFSCALFEVSSG